MLTFFPAKPNSESNILRQPDYRSYRANRTESSIPSYPLGLLEVLGCFLGPWLPDQEARCAG